MIISTIKYLVLAGYSNGIQIECILISLSILHENYIFLEEDGRGVHHSDKEGVDVVLEVCDLLALTLHGALEPD